MKPAPPHAEPMTDLPAAAPQWAPVRQKTPAENAKNVFLVVALALLTVSIAVAYYSANSIVSIWFQDQWAPVARLVLALLVGSVAVWAIMRLTQRKAP